MFGALKGSSGRIAFCHPWKTTMQRGGILLAGRLSVAIVHLVPILHTMMLYTLPSPSADSP